MPSKPGAPHDPNAPDQGAPPLSVDEALKAIERMYYEATAQTIERDFTRAIALLKAMPDEATRERAAVYMDGLAQMRRDWERPRKAGTKDRARGSRGPRE